MTATRLSWSQHCRADSPAFGPVDEIVSNERPMNHLFCLKRDRQIKPCREPLRAVDRVVPTHRRKLSSIIAASYSVHFSPLARTSSSQAKYRTRAAPSRMWHCRKPSTSVWRRRRQHEPLASAGGHESTYGILDRLGLLNHRSSDFDQILYRSACALGT
jgi:hypothetical protein